MEIIKTLGYVPLFQEVSPKIYAQVDIATTSTVKNYRSGNLIHSQHEKCCHLDVILSGIVSVQALEKSGSTITISEFGNGETLGSNLLFSSRPQYPMFVVAKTDVTILRITRETILKLCNIDSDFLEKYLQEISDKALVLTGKINSIALKSIRESVTEYLLLEQQYQKTNTILLPFNKKEWAELLGVQRPSLSRELNRMRQEGLIEYHNRLITIKKL